MQQLKGFAFNEWGSATAEGDSTAGEEDVQKDLQLLKEDLELLE